MRNLIKLLLCGRKLLKTKTYDCVAISFTKDILTAFLYYQAKQSRIHNVFGIVSFCQEESVSDDYLVNSVTLVTAVQLRFTTALCAVKMIR